MDPTGSSTTTLAITVKAYPNPSRKYGETVCVAGIALNDPGGARWCRLYPVAFRDLDFDRRFRKWDVITVSTTPTGNDLRPESRRPLRDTIEVVRHIDTSVAGYAERKRLISPLVADSMCAVLRQERIDRTSLAAIRPTDIRGLQLEPNGRVLGQVSRGYGGQLSFDRPDKDLLEELPYHFKLIYRCGDRRCRGHTQSIIDWEIGQFFRRQRAAGMSLREAGEATRTRWLEVVFGDDRDPTLFVGNQHQHRQGFLVLGALWPPRRYPKDQLPLF